MRDDLIDLHVHSNCSDGKKTVEEILNMAYKNHVTALAFSEHYNMGSYKRARMLAKDKIEIIPAVELGCSLRDYEFSNRHVCHIVAYYASFGIFKLLDAYEESRDKCVKKTIQQLQKQIDISFSKIVKYARKKTSIGRFDIAIALHKLGYASDPISAYGEFLDAGKSGYVTRYKPSPHELIQEIRKYNGVPVIVHPKSIKMNYNDSFNFIKSLKESGLEGIEIYNPHNTDEQRYFFRQIANELDLLPTVGSDYHGMSDQKIEIGLGIDNNLCISDYNMIEDLKARQNRIISK